MAFLSFCWRHLRAAARATAGVSAGNRHSRRLCLSMDTRSECFRLPRGLLVLKKPLASACPNPQAEVARRGRCCREGTENYVTDARRQQVFSQNVARENREEIRGAGGESALHAECPEPDISRSWNDLPQSRTGIAVKNRIVGTVKKSRRASFPLCPQRAVTR